MAVAVMDLLMRMIQAPILIIPSTIPNQVGAVEARRAKHLQVTVMQPPQPGAPNRLADHPMAAHSKVPMVVVEGAAGVAGTMAAAEGVTSAVPVRAAADM